ncbi:MAG: NAD-dependent epimerase/dehydratase family protein [bacterium]
MPVPATSFTPDAGRTPVILVTGGAGFLGYHLVRRLLADGCQIRILDDLSTGSRDNVPVSPKVQLIEGSVMRADDVARAAAGGVDGVIHLAGVVGMRLAVGDRERAYTIAVEGTEKVLAGTGNAPSVLFSSSAVYGHTEKVAVSEDMTPGEAGVKEYDGGYSGYATGKWELEQMGQAAAAAGRSILIVRPFNVVGSRQTPTYGMVIPNFIKWALAGQPLQVFDNGLQSRSFGEVRTFCDTLVRLIGTNGAWTPEASVFNIGTQECTAIGDLARMVLEETDSHSTIEYVPYTTVFPGKRDVFARIPNTGRLESLIGPVEWPDMRAIIRDLTVQVRESAAVPQ